MLDADRTPTPEVLAALPIFPLPNAVLLPGMILPLNVFEPRYLDLVDHAMATGGYVGIPLIRRNYVTSRTRQPPIEPVFGIGHIVSHQALADGRRFIRVEGLGRVRLREELPVQTRFRQMAVELLPESDLQDGEQLEILQAQIERIASTLDPEDADMVECVLGIPDERVLIYAVTAILPTLGLILPLDQDWEEDGLNPYLRLQQQSLSAESADARVSLLLDQSARICSALSSSGRFARCMLN